MTPVFVGADRTLNIPTPGIDSASRLAVVMANRHLSFRLQHTRPIRNFDPCPPFAYNICASFRSGLRSRCPLPIMTHPLMVASP